MTTTNRDKFLTEAMGECWHEWKWIAGNGLSCKNCDIDLYGANNTTYQQMTKTPDNNDFSTWPGFGLLWTWAIDQGWWGEFIYSTGGKTYQHEIRLDGRAIHPDRFATAVYEYLKEKQP